MQRRTRRALALLLSAGTTLTTTQSIHAQGRGGAEWTTSGGDAQRTSWV